MLLQDFPGLGKTLAARSLAQALGIEFTRAQFTPDLLPADLTGSFIYNQRIGDFEFREGPLFTGLLLADEINRTPPKTQAALLEAMQERQVTVEGRTFELPPPFHVLATANPVEYEGTYPLPEAQLDRFLLSVGFGYPTARGGVRRPAQPDRPPAANRWCSSRSPTRPGCSRCRRPSRRWRSTAASASTASRWSTASRSHRDVLIGASPRGSLALMLCARALALVSGRDFVLPEDVKAVGAGGARPPDHRQARAVDDRRDRRQRGEPAARDGADATGQGAARPETGRGTAMDPSLTGAWRPTAALVRSVVMASTTCSRRSPSAGRGCSCSPPRSRWRRRWRSRTLRASRPPRSGCGWPTAGCTRGRAPGSRSPWSPRTTSSR